MYWGRNYLVSNQFYNCVKAGVVLSRLKGQPLSLCLLRWRGENGAVYRPLVPLLRQLKQENPRLEFGSPLPKPSVPHDSQSQCIKEGRWETPLHSCAHSNEDLLPPSAYKWINIFCSYSVNRLLYAVQLLGKTNIGMVQ